AYYSYSTGKETTFNMNVQLPSGGGTYYLVFDYPTLPNKKVTGTITVTYQGPSYVQYTETPFGVGASLGPGDSSITSFTVPNWANEVVLSGTLTVSGGSGNNFTVYVFNSTGLTDWENGHQASAYYSYSTGKETTFNMNVQLPSGGGTYYLVFDYPASNKNVTGTITVTYYVPRS
ncbi:MAG: hypothetical protein RXP91_06105, partial [Nitrososphaeria archaeon]